MLESTVKRYAERKIDKANKYQVDMIRKYLLYVLLWEKLL